MDLRRNPNSQPFALIAIMATGLLIAGPSVYLYAHTLLLCSVTLYLYVMNRSATNTGVDIEDQTLSAAMREEHQLLLESIHHYPMPYAIYDKNDRLIVWNQQYEEIYAHTFDALKDKLQARQLSYRDLIQSNASESLSGQALEEYVDQRVAHHRDQVNSVVDREYPQYGWYRVSKNMMPSGGVAGFAIDINELKQREADLLREVERRERLEVKIRKLANTDALTGIANRRHFVERVEIEFDRTQQSKNTLCLMMIDIDHFKSVNDTYGHAAGDEVITTVAMAAASEVTSDSDLIGRLGGEEFAVLLSGVGEDDGRQVAERIRQSIQSLSFVSDGRGFTIAVSIGVANLSEIDTDSTALLKRADNALYKAKACGRNRVEIASGHDETHNRATG